MVYELKDSESESHTKSRILILNAESEEVKNDLLTGYANVVEGEEVCESFYESPDKDLSRYLSTNGFSLQMNEGLDIAVTIEDIKKIFLLLKVKKMPRQIMSLSDISLMQYRSFVKECLFNGRRGLLDDLAYIPKAWFEQEISSCAVEDEKVRGVLLLKKAPSGLIFVNLFTAFGPDYQQNLGFMMAHTAQKIVEMYPDDTRVIIRRHNTMVKRLTDRFFAGNKGDEVFCGEREEI
jgi:hypothetical protein